MTSSSAASVVYDEIRAIVAALVGGARYGVRIRLPHAAVMTALFRKNLSAQEKLRNVLMLVREHASNLAVFAALYKTILALLKLLSRRLRGLDSLQQREREENILRSLGRLFVLTFGKKVFSVKRNVGSNCDFSTKMDLVPVYAMTVMPYLQWVVTIEVKLHLYVHHQDTQKESVTLSLLEP